MNTEGRRRTWSFVRVGVAAVVVFQVHAARAETLRFEVPGEPAAVYQTGAPLDPSLQPFAEAVAGRWPELGFSSCLSRAAELYLGATTSLATNDLPHELLEFLARRAGCPEPPIIVTVASTGSDGLDELLGHVDEVLANARVRFSHLGMARIPSPTPPFQWRWAVVLSHRAIELQRVPAVLEPGSSVPLRFSFAAGLGDAQVLLVRPGGAVEVAGLRQRDGLYETVVAAGETVGTLWVDIRSGAGSAEKVLAHFDLQVGQPRPKVWVGPAIPDETGVVTSDAAEALMVELVNADRQRFGLPPLTADPSLASVARAHSWDMVQNGFIAHVSPRFGGLAQRLALAGYPARSMRENVARATSISEAEASLLTSRDHRANLVAPDVTRLGVGVVQSQDGGSRQWLVTQVFADPIETLSGDELEELVEGQARARRRGRGLMPLRRSRELDHWARVLARTAVEHGGLEPSRLASVQHGLASTEGSLPRVRAELITIDDMALFEFGDVVEETDLATLGIGVERRRGDGGEVVSTIVVLVADR